MCWLKRSMWKACIAIAGLLIFLVFMVWVPLSAGAYEGASGLATPVTGTVQETPTVNVTATMTALQEDKLQQEIQQLKNQNAPDFFDWLRTNAAILLSTLVIVIGGLIGLFRWFGDRRSEREKRAEERFQTIVVGLGSNNIESKVGSAIMLRTFLQPGYDAFHRQVFDLTVAHLRLRKANFTQSEQLDAPKLSIIDVSGKPLPVEHNLSIDSLSQALISAFKLSVPLARKQAEIARYRILKQSPQFILFALLYRTKDPFFKTGLRSWYFPQLLDATNIQLDDASLFGADLAEVTLGNASLQRAVLYFADLKKVDLRDANLRNADLRDADLRGARFWGADLSYANLRKADLSGTNLEKAKSLYGTKLREAKGLSKEQLAACKAKGAIIDEDDKSTAF